jgi:CheY-like chemotaxis protein
MAKILCVEDEELIRKLVVEELQDEGHETIEASNGEEGLKAIKAHKPDLVLCDVNMPVMDGCEMLTTVRENHPEFADMPIIFLTAQSDRKDIIAGQKLGADDYLTKPIDYEMLLISVDTRLKQVDRMGARKQDEMVKLYKALSTGDQVELEELVPVTPEAEVEDSGPTVAVVCNGETDLSGVIQALDAQGCKIEKYTSGSAFHHAVDKLDPDMLLITFDTTDNQAPFVMKVLGGKTRVKFGSVVLVPAHLKKMCGTTQTSVFDAFVLMPTPDETVVEVINRVFKVRNKQNAEEAVS